MEENISSDQILGYLKGKYLSKPTGKVTTPSTNEDSEKSKDNIPVGEESEDSGEKAENRFLLGRLERVQGELTKWLDILKTKINNS